MDRDGICHATPSGTPRAAAARRALAERVESCRAVAVVRLPGPPYPPSYASLTVQCPLSSRNSAVADRSLYAPRPVAPTWQARGAAYPEWGPRCETGDWCESPSVLQPTCRWRVRTLRHSPRITE